MVGREGEEGRDIGRGGGRGREGMRVVELGKDREETEIGEMVGLKSWQEGKETEIEGVDEGMLGRQKVKWRWGSIICHG